MRAIHHRVGRFAAALTLLASTGAAFAAPVEVTVTNVHGDRGHVRVDVCTAAQFLHDCVFGGQAPAYKGEVVVNIVDVPPGEYAVQAYQDENDDHRVDRNHFGIPTEGFGFSHDASFSLGPPKFVHARFTVAEDEVRLRVKLHYLPH